MYTQGVTGEYLAWPGALILRARSVADPQKLASKKLKSKKELKKKRCTKKNKIIFFLKSEIRGLLELFSPI